MCSCYFEPNEALEGEKDSFGDYRNPLTNRGKETQGIPRLKEPGAEQPGDCVFLDTDLHGYPSETWGDPFSALKVHQASCLNQQKPDNRSGCTAVNKSPESLRISFMAVF